jgi:hypothetical protein
MVLDVFARFEGHGTRVRVFDFKTTAATTKPTTTQQ